MSTFIPPTTFTASDMIKLYFTNKNLYNNLQYFTKNTVTNPLDRTDTCILHNTKKESLYTHTYNPTVYIKELKELGIADEILSKFDDKINTNCCKVIAISLYFPKCKIDNMEKYLFSIYRTVKNVEKKLNDWIVRLYFDMTVYNCVLNISTEINQKSVLINDDNDEKVNGGIDEKVNDDIKRIFEYIINSPNVELYTYKCDNTKIPIEKTRTLRFLPLSDPDVALCVVREADGIVSNLDCQNIKLFDESKKLFYLPQLNRLSNLFEFYDDDDIAYEFYRYNSYSYWLRLYKKLIEREYFLNHQNLYDLLAGLFAIKLRFNRKKYMECIQELTDKINILLTNAIKMKDKEYDKHEIVPQTGKCSRANPENKYEHNVPYPYRVCIFNLINTVDLNILNFNFNIGFDEILLLDFLKEIISIPLPYAGVLTEQKDISLYNARSKLFFQHNINNIVIKKKAIVNNNKIDFNLILNILRITSNLNTPLSALIIKINSFFANNEETDENILLMIDTLLSYIILTEPCIITYKGNVGLTYPNNSTVLLNTPYKLMYDEYYD